MAVPSARSAHASSGSAARWSLVRRQCCDRRQQVQGGEQP
jgi:hypothetical protein